jgi:hypothetical protein
MDLALIDAANRSVNGEHGDVRSLHERVDHLGYCRVIHLTADLVHAALCTIQRDLLGELEDEELILPAELEF